MTQIFQNSDKMFNIRVDEGRGIPIIQNNILILEFSCRPNILRMIAFNLSSNLFILGFDMTRAQRPLSKVGIIMVTITSLIIEYDICLLSLKALPNVDHIWSSHFDSLCVTFTVSVIFGSFVQIRPK